VRCRDATASPFVAKVRGEVFPHFHVVAVQRHRSVQELQDEVSVSDHLHVKANEGHVCNFSPISSSSVFVSLDFPCTARAFFAERLSNRCQGLRRTFSEIYSKFRAVPLSDLSRYHIRPDTRLQIKGHKIRICTQLHDICTLAP
jgi:hypothetical protein